MTPRAAHAQRPAPVRLAGAGRIDPFGGDAVRSSPRVEALEATAAMLDRPHSVARRSSAMRSAPATLTMGSGVGIGALPVKAAGTHAQPALACRLITLVIAHR